MAFTNTDNFGFLTTDVARLYRAELDRLISNAGIDLTPAAARTLFHVERNGPSRQTALAEKMGIEAMTMSGYLDQLEKRGLIERVPDPDDRRAKLVYLTAAAEPVLSAIKKIASDLRENLSRSVGPKDWETVNHALKIIREQLTSNCRD